MMSSSSYGSYGDDARQAIGLADELLRKFDSGSRNKT